MTDKCPRCNVKVDANLKNCPLCGAYIERDEDANATISKIDYGYPVVSKDAVWREFFLRVAIYACLISIGICFLVNYLAVGSIFWAYHILFGWVVFWFTIARSLFFHLDIRKQIFWYSIFACVICFYIQSVSNKAFVIAEELNWALIWATPAFLLGGIAGLFAYMVIEYRNWIRLAMPLTMMCLATAIPAIMAAIMYGHVHFMICISLGVGVITLLMMMILGREKYFLELKKKFFI